MTVKEMIDKLKEFNGDMEVVITDGYECFSYCGEYKIKEVLGTVDVGVGGFRI